MLPKNEADLIRSFSRIEDDLCHSIASGPSSTKSFAERLSILQKESTINLANLNPSSLSSKIVHTVVTNISTIATTFLDLESKAEDIGSQLQQDISDIFGSLSLTDLSHSSAFSQDESAVQTSIPRCHNENWQWLLENIDKPYPSLPLKRKMARQSGTTIKAISEWFTQARRRIGWTSLSKRYFQGDRQLTVDCAHRVFYERDAYLAYPTDLIRDLETMRGRAKRLAAKKSRCSDLATVLVEDAVDNEFEALKGVRKSHKSTPYELSSSMASQKPVSIPSICTTPKKTNQNNIDGGEKRRRGSGSDTDTDCDAFRLTKRSRICMSPLSRSVSLTTSTSSRASTVELQTPTSDTVQLPYLEADETINAWLSVLTSESLSPQGAPRPTTKRRFSDASSCVQAKRLRTHSDSVVTSEALPTPESLDDIDNILSHLDFSLPPPAFIHQDLFMGDLLQLKVFDNVGWQGSDSNNLFSLDNGEQEDITNQGQPIDWATLNDLLTPPDRALEVHDASPGVPGSVATMRVEAVADSDQHAFEYIDLGSEQTPTLPTPPNFISIADTSTDYTSLSQPHCASALRTDFQSSVNEREAFPKSLLRSAEPGDFEKLEKIHQLLAEAARLQQEVLY